MKIFEVSEFDSIKPEKLDFDLADDLAFFIQNDPMFYRKEMYPVVVDFTSNAKAGRKSSPKIFVPVVKKAIKVYCTQFNIPLYAHSHFDKQLVADTASKLFEIETEQLNTEHP